MSTMSQTVKVTINGAERELPAGRTIAQTLELLGLTPQLVVVEHNRVILERSRAPEVEVREGDNLEIVHFVGGG
jgi:thiamine biosynthesis protein ThiS